MTIRIVPPRVKILLTQLENRLPDSAVKDLHAVRRLIRGYGAPLFRTVLQIGARNGLRLEFERAGRPLIGREREMWALGASEDTAQRFVRHLLDLVKTEYPREMIAALDRIGIPRIRYREWVGSRPCTPHLSDVLAIAELLHFSVRWIA